jgi:hypothetical protein
MEEEMKFACMGCIDESAWDGLSDAEKNTMMEECFAYDDVLREGGHFVGGKALQSASQAVTLRWKDGKVVTTDGPFAETKEQIGGLLFLEARDLNHAIALMSKHPGVRFGPFEIRPVHTEITAMVEARDQAVKNRVGARS